MKIRNKEDIRKALLSQRTQLSDTTQQQKSARIIQNIEQSDIFMKASHIAFFHAVRGEANPADLVKVASSHTQFYLPVISPNNDKHLFFAPANKDTQFKNNVFAIPEPIVHPSEMIKASELDLVIMPLLGFDNYGNRLGMGGGYYDRSFAFKKENISKPILLGFAYDFQKVESITAEPWDIGLDMVATESTLIRF